MAFYHQGTVTPKGEIFNAEEAAQGLKDAMKGLGTDEKKIIDILSEHANYERQEIKTKYKTMFGADIGTDEGTLIEILTSRSNGEIARIKEHYKDKYDQDLEEEIKSETSGNLQNILVSLLQANRSEEETIDNDQVLQDAKDLFEAGAKTLGTDESVFNKVLAIRSYTHLKSVFEEYAKLDKRGIEGAIKAETSGDLQKTYLSIAQCVYNKLPLLAESFHNCLKGAGTDDEKLMQLVVSHCEIDLLNISECYMGMYKKSLPRMVEDDTSGDYRKLLMKLINPK